MPTRPQKPVAAPATPVPRPNRQPGNTTRPDGQPPPDPSAHPVADSSPVPRRVNTPRTHVSLVVRNARRSRNVPFYASVPRYNHYLLARSFVEDDYPPKPLATKQKPRENHDASPSQWHHDNPPPDFIISDFIWRFSAPRLDSKTRETFAELKSCDPETFKELVAGLD